MSCGLGDGGMILIVLVVVIHNKNASFTTANEVMTHFGDRESAGTATTPGFVIMAAPRGSLWLVVFGARNAVLLTKRYPTTKVRQPSADTLIHILHEPLPSQVSETDI